MSYHPLFTQAQIEAIAKELAAWVTGTEIQNFLVQTKITDTDPGITKWIRLYNAFCNSQNTKQKRTHILEFIRKVANPLRFTNNKQTYDELREKLNKVLYFCGIEIRENGELFKCQAVETLSEAEKRASELKLSLTVRDIHPDVLKFCKAELLVENYFHAVVEAVKSIFDKLRKISGHTEDGENLINFCFCGDMPLLKINPLKTKSEKMEQLGFAGLIKGIYAMFRNPMSHEAKINWEIKQKDAEDLLTMASMIHRRLDKVTK